MTVLIYIVELINFIGTGKTTIIKKLIEDLKKLSFHANGFYTEEVRDEKHERLGFDIFSFNGSRGILARSSETANIKVISKHKIGKYSVFVEDFENIALPIFDGQASSTLIIDEIGKMELLSDKFERQIKRLMADVKSKKKSLIATIPSSVRGRPIALVEELKAIDSAKLFVITKSNRNSIYEQIFDDTKTLLKL